MSLKLGLELVKNPSWPKNIPGYVSWMCKYPESHGQFCVQYPNLHQWHHHRSNYISQTTGSHFWNRDTSYPTHHLVLSTSPPNILLNPPTWLHLHWYSLIQVPLFSCKSFLEGFLLLLWTPQSGPHSSQVSFQNGTMIILILMPKTLWWLSIVLGVKNEILIKPVSAVGLALAFLPCSHLFHSHLTFWREDAWYRDFSKAVHS